MEELLRWAEHEPTTRRFLVSFDGSVASRYVAQVWTAGSEVVGEGRGMSLVFAAVRAFDDLSSKMSAE